MAMFTPSVWAERDSSLHESHVIPAKVGIQFLPDMDPRFRGGDVLAFISMAGPEGHGNSVESHVIPAKAGIHVTWTPAFAGVTARCDA
jgi:hypothetical protein